VIVPLPPTSAVAFVDAQHGWIGDAAGLFSTTDGRHFRLAARTPVIGIDALDRTHAWVLSGYGLILRTTNGRTWQTLTAPHLFTVRFVDRRNGFGLTRDGIVVRSSDAGKSWRTTVHTPGLMQTQCFSSTRDGWVARSGSVWATHNGGANWMRVRLWNTRFGPAQPALRCRGGSLWALFAGGAAAGSEGYEVFRSLDRGRTWRAVLAGLVTQRLPRINAYAGPFLALGGGRAIFEGTCGPCVFGHGTVNFVRTVDGGRTFARATPYIRSFVGGPISFRDVRRGWLLTQLFRSKKHTLLFTRDGGGHWQRVAAIP
jgi:photosystem II stability/assembly factor-like uncharacterized protein